MIHIFIIYCLRPFPVQFGKRLGCGRTNKDREAWWDWESCWWHGMMSDCLERVHHKFAMKLRMWYYVFYDHVCYIDIQTHFSHDYTMLMFLRKNDRHIFQPHPLLPWQVWSQCPSWTTNATNIDAGLTCGDGRFFFWVMHRLNFKVFGK